MTVVGFDFNFFMKLVFFILIPIILVVILGYLAIKYHSDKIEDKNSPLYNYSMEYYSSILAMGIVGVLLAVVTGFSFSFIHTMEIKNLVSNNQMIYYAFMLLPILPLSFFIYYLRRFIVAANGRSRCKKAMGE